MPLLEPPDQHSVDHEDRKGIKAAPQDTVAATQSRRSAEYPPSPGLICLEISIIYMTGFHLPSESLACRP